ncbi:MAG: bifunctional phosphopantothenoylcysteine decarboxylase/phosphopantothenate--cysteine ligase CoaBC [Microthrixaceae bacterium]
MTDQPTADPASYPVAGRPFVGRHIVVGVTGGIAAYKAVEVVRRLVDGGAFVSPIMTAGARRFLGETTLSALSSEPVRSSLWDEADPIPHTRLGQGADAVVVVPATARLLSAYASGYSSDLLVATLLATRAPVVVCPAMHTEMWEHPAVQDNLATLRARGVVVVDPESGRLAGGDVGAGRLAAPETIVTAVRGVLVSRPVVDTGSGAGDLLGLHVLVTAGGTREPIDPVRFIGNRSSGRQGHAVAEAALRRGARVTLVTTTDRTVPDGIERHAVGTAAELHDVVARLAPDADVVVMVAAVADFTPATVADHKLKKADGVPRIELVPTVDILAELGHAKRADQTLVGFAAETFDLAANAQAKLVAKRADLIVANDVAAPSVGFEHDTNAVTIWSATHPPVAVGLTGKDEVADAVLDAVVLERSGVAG